MIKEIINRMAVLAGLDRLAEENVDENVEVETARGISRDTWESMNQREKKNYVDGHPKSVYYYEFYSKQTKVGLKKIKDQIKELKALQGKYKGAKKQNEIQAQIDKLKKKGKKLQDFAKSLGFNGKDVKPVKPAKPISTIKPVKDTNIKVSKENTFKQNVNASKPVKPAKNIKSNNPNTVSKVSNSNDRYGKYKYITDPDGIKELMPKGVKYTVNKDGTVDVQSNIGKIKYHNGKGSSNLHFNKLIDDKGHFKVKFGKVSGNFECGGCKNLTSLEGAPKEVGGRFDCSYCSNLTSLEGAPKEVGGDFDCAYCEMSSLEGAPSKVSGNFECYDCENLTSLKGAPKEVGGRFWCFDCKKLTSLEGAPEKVDGYFNCDGCDNLTSLEGAPKVVGGDFNCVKCENLTSLKGAPKKVGGDFWCSKCNSLTSLEGAPKVVGGRFDCWECKNLISLEGAPEEVGGVFDCSRCYKLKSLKGFPKKLKKFICENNSIKPLQYYLHVEKEPYVLVDGNKLTDEDLKSFPKSGNFTFYCTDKNMQEKLKKLNTKNLTIDIEENPERLFINNILRYKKKGLLEACHNYYSDDDIKGTSMYYTRGFRDDPHGIVVVLPTGKAYGDGYDSYATASLYKDGRIVKGYSEHYSHTDAINYLKDKMMYEYKNASEDFRNLITSNDGKICNITVKQEFD